MSLENSQKEILVCVPAFNAENSIRETLQSILAQSYRNFDVLVVDNHSTDGTVSAIQKFRDEFDTEGRIYIRENKENIGRVGNWNQCLKIFRKTSHAFLKFVFTGDTLERNCLQKSMNVFQQYPQIGFIASGYYICGAGGETSKKISFEKAQYLASLHALKLFLRKSNWVGAPVSCMFSRKAVACQNFSEKLDWTADWKFYVDIATKFDSFYTTELLGKFHAMQRKHYSRYKANLSTKIKEFSMYCYIIKMIAYRVLKNIFI